MPSSAVHSHEQFFTHDDVTRLTRTLSIAAPLIKGRVWGGEERTQGWSVECESFEAFSAALGNLRDHIEFLAFDEMALDEDTIRVVQDDLYRYAEEENISNDLVNKGLSALRSHENEVYSVVVYAFLTSGRVVFARAQNELAGFVYRPERLLTNEGLNRVRKLKTLIEH